MARNRLTTVPKACEICGTEFMRSGNTQKYCPDCISRYGNAGALAIRKYMNDTNGKPRGCVDLGSLVMRRTAELEYEDGQWRCGSCLTPFDWDSVDGFDDPPNARFCANCGAEFVGVVDVAKEEGVHDG